MAFRSKEMFKRIIWKVGEENMAPGVKESLKKCLPDSKVVMGRAKRGIYAGRHIQFGNQVSEDGGHSIRWLEHKPLYYPDLSLSARSILNMVNCKMYSVVKDESAVSLLVQVQTRRNWKPNVQEKRLFSYIIDRHIRVKVTTHALRCIDKAGGIDEYLLKTPYNKMDTEMGLFWKAKIEKMYEELGDMEVTFFSPEDEAKFEQGFKDLKLDERAARRESRRKNYSGSRKQKQIGEGKPDAQVTEQDGARIEEGKQTS
ncbi:hypothetical protein HHK36_021025 [Tetracentron sinense]|uniref:Large ribosomal subunit protein bL28m n=1 Tax=Tetracentron sinense TaxID=13715 RepID=A0A835D6Z1_TETSI|nr:hypothetical protein HHK36_021025 [Tetracentron sinense]